LVYDFRLRTGSQCLLARRRFGIKYPTMYSDTNIQFNCMQRVHAN
ncbi:hypothetical protein CEXT_665791, partial [Caerostris extrusa]